MTTKEELHEIIDSLSEEQADLARIALDDLLEAAGPDEEPVDEHVLGSLDRGITDVAAGRVTALEAYERKRGL